MVWQVWLLLAMLACHGGVWVQANTPSTNAGEGGPRKWVPGTVLAFCTVSLLENLSPFSVSLCLSDK